MVSRLACTHTIMFTLNDLREGITSICLHFFVIFTRLFFLDFLRVNIHSYSLSYNNVFNFVGYIVISLSVSSPDCVRKSAGEYSVEGGIYKAIS